MEMLHSIGPRPETGEQHPGIPRRQFLQAAAAVGLTTSAIGSWKGGVAVAAGTAGAAAAADMRLGSHELVVQPVLAYSVRQRLPARSWRGWGNIHTRHAAKQEAERIERELKQVFGLADFAVRVLPVAEVANPREAESLKEVRADVRLVYVTQTATEVLDALAGLGKWIVLVAKYTYPAPYILHNLWTRVVSSRSLQDKCSGVDVDDLLVHESDSDNEEIIWRLRALYGLKNVLGRRVVCVGGPSGWGPASLKAPKLAH